LQYFSKKKLVLPEGYFVNSSQIPQPKEVNKLLANCGCETFPIKPLSEAIQKSNFFFTIQSQLKNKLYGFVRVTSDRGLNANLWNLSALPGNNQQLYYSILLQVTLEKKNREMPGCSISVQAPVSSFISLEKNALQKLKDKNCDWIIANDVSKDESGFDNENNEVTIFYKNKKMKKEKLSLKKKSEISEEIVDRIVAQIN